MQDFDFDLFVVGAGSGGVRAARIAAGHGAKVMIAEEFRIGGTCVIRGCVPKKLYVYASRFADEFEDAAGFGWHVPQPPRFDWRQLVEAKEKEISRLSGLYRLNLERAGVAIVETRAVLEDRHRVRLADGKLVSARHVLVATGARPVLEPAIPGRELAITSNEVFDLERFPERMTIVGGGYIAVEFASIFARLGTKVTQVMRGESVLRGFDEDMRDGVAEALRKAGVRLVFATLPTRIEKAARGLEVNLSNDEEVVCDQVLIATGRKPATAGLGLEKAGVVLDHHGAVKVDAYSKSSVENVHAVGDVTNRVNLTPVAIREGHALADTLFGGAPTAVVHTQIPTAVFTTPELGTVGLTEHEARSIFAIVDIYTASFRPLKATLSGRAEKTIMKLIVDGETDRVLGVHILGESAGEMAQLLAIAVKMGAKKADFDATIALHPSAAEELVTMHTRVARHERQRLDAGPGAAVAEM